MTIEIRPYQTRDEAAVVRLWTDCGLVVSWNNPRRDIRRKLEVQADLFLVASLDGRIVATVMAGYDGHRGWINYLAVHPNHRGAGIGRCIMNEAETLLRASGCPKINLQVRRANVNVIEFYKKIGYQEDNVVSLGKRLERDE
jgi:ribosomal protein S18 acetylase RimI-like enzyme